MRRRPDGDQRFQEETSVQDISQGSSQMFGHGSISFGRFDLESLQWEKWSVFANDRRHEEFGKFNGLVAKKKAYFEEYFKRIRELKALQQQNQQTELHLEYSGDGSDSSQTGEHEPAADHGAPNESETLVDDSMERTTAATTSEHEMECYGYHENERLCNEFSASTYSSPTGCSQQICKQMRENVGGKIDLLKQDANSSQDDSGIVHEIMIAPKRIIEKGSQIAQASKIIPKTVKTTSSNVTDHTIVTKGPGSGIPSVKNQMAKPEKNILSLRRPREATSDLVGASARSGIVGLRRPSSPASQRPSIRERRPVTRDASRKPSELTSPCRPSTSERRPGTRQSALTNVDNASPCRPPTADRRTITKELASNQCNIATPHRPSTANRRPVTKDSTPKLSSIATPRPPSAGRCAVTKDSTPKPFNIYTQRRPSTADRRPIPKESAPKYLNVASPHRPTTGKSHTGTTDIASKDVGIATSCRPSAVKQCPITRESAHKHADVVTLCRPTAERHPIVRDVAPKHGTVALPSRPSTADRCSIARDVAPKRALLLRPSTAERRPVSRDVEPKHAPPHRPSTAERRPVTRETALKQTNVGSSYWPLTPDRCLTKRSGITTPRQPSTGERRPITHGSTMKPDPKTPIRSRATPKFLNGAIVTEVTPQKAVTPSVVKSSKLEFHVDGNQKSSPLNLPPTKMLASNQGLENFRKPNKGLQEGVWAHAYKSINVTPQQTGRVKTRAPVPPPPPPPPCRPYCTEKAMNVHSSPVGPQLHTGTNPVSRILQHNHFKLGSENEASDGPGKASWSAANARGPFITGRPTEPAIHQPRPVTSPNAAHENIPAVRLGRSSRTAYTSARRGLQPVTAPSSPASRPPKARVGGRAAARPPSRRRRPSCPAAPSVHPDAAGFPPAPHRRRLGRPAPPSSPSTRSAAVSIDELRPAAADSCQRYANLRRRLLIDPHLSKDEEGAPDLIVENPLSQIRRQTLI
ncbi:hypothetical protein U9M48_044020 [Paspalum notatum var. saurae]|uniref:TPX2 C-terminal domain-containing protein n=1 Tax=Paspalum notatum var. saurae TaxID=547442 RepID=A0AAQ3UY57_PASNO